MSNGFEYADELGPHKVIQIREPGVGLNAVLVLDNTAAGPAIGGLRMAADGTVKECVRLARAMTLKNAMAELPHGGAKSMIYGDPKMPREHKELLVRALAAALGEVNSYIFGPDMGTDEGCMALVKDELGGRAVGLPREIGGIPLDELGATGWGIYHAVQVALRQLDFDLTGARLVVQGFGAVGRHAARFLTNHGAVLVAVADSRGAVYHPSGLNLDKLVALKDEGRSVGEYPGGQLLSRDAVIDVECDIWIPAARPDVIREDNEQKLNTRLVVEGANIPITAAAEKKLHERGILCVPDFIANAGGVICAAMEYAGSTQAQALQAVEEKLRRNTELVLTSARHRQVTPREAALALAVQRVQRAMGFKRWSLF